MLEKKRRKHLKTQVLQTKTWGTHAPSNFRSGPPARVRDLLFECGPYLDPVFLGATRTSNLESAA